MKPYTQIPTVEQFLKDTGRTKHKHLKFLNLSDDPLMNTIDGLLDKWEKHCNGIIPLSHGSMLYVLSRIFYSAQMWLNHPKSSPRRKTQGPVVEALWKITVDKMCWAFDCSVNVLPDRLEKLYGKAIIQDLAAAGDDANPTHYFNKVELAIYRLSFQNGLAYMWDWYKKSGDSKRDISSMKLVKANSLKAWRKRTITPGFSGYALRSDHEFFMARHRGSEDSEGKPKIAHSAYTSGNPVLCAGEVAIANGRILCVTTASGHYQPKPDKMLHVLRVFRMNGVDMSNLIVGIELGPHQPYNRYKAIQFMQACADTSRLTPISQKETRKLFTNIPGWIDGTRGLYDFPMSDEEIFENMIRG